MEKKEKGVMMNEKGSKEFLSYDICDPYDKEIHLESRDKIKSVLPGENFTLVKNSITSKCVEVVQTIDQSKPFRPQVKEGFDLLIKIGDAIEKPLTRLSLLPDELDDTWNSEKNEAMQKEFHDLAKKTGGKIFNTHDYSEIRFDE